MKIVKYAFIAAAVLIIAIVVFFQVFFRTSIPNGGREWCSTSPAW